MIKELSEKEIEALRRDTFAKGGVFEKLVVDLFPEKVFALIYATTTREDLNGRKVESAKNPDFQFQHRPTGHKFWVECKYRKSLFKKKLHWCEPWQFDRYKKFQEDIRPQKVFVVMGKGGNPNTPDEMYCMPLDEIKYPALYPSVLEPYKRPVDKSFWYNGGRLK